mmetsp:Transcript_2523/g.4265  ORF Transcript_2523/g.4265 Transcript_2523/m.4265 type:complete len:131 (-) Transcript_2523:2523-2915(-)
MHPQLIPEHHPKCGKVMEALVQCRLDNPIHRYWGACNQVTFDLSKCLVEEKKEYRAPRQAKYIAQWEAKREADKIRMAELDAEEAARLAAQGAAPVPGTPSQAAVSVPDVGSMAAGGSSGSSSSSRQGQL